MIDANIRSWGFSALTFDSRLYLQKRSDDLIILFLVVDDVVFASNNQELLDDCKSYLQQHIVVKLYGTLTSFIGWSVERTTKGLTRHQNQYAWLFLRR